MFYFSFFANGKGRTSWVCTERHRRDIFYLKRSDFTCFCFNHFQSIQRHKHIRCISFGHKRYSLLMSPTHVQHMESALTTVHVNERMNVLAFFTTKRTIYLYKRKQLENHPTDTLLLNAYMYVIVWSER